MNVPSPCNGVCRIETASGWCAGCLRTLDEIAGWGGFSDQRKRAVLQELALRRTVGAGSGTRAAADGGAGGGDGLAATPGATPAHRP